MHGKVSQKQAETVLELADKTSKWSVQLPRTHVKMAQEGEKQEEKR